MKTAAVWSKILPTLTLYCWRSVNHLRLNISATPAAAVAAARESGKPTVAVLISGRPRIVTEELKDWNAFVMAWLPGSEGAQALVNALWGHSTFSGRLPFTWPIDNASIPIHSDDGNIEGKILFPFGFGL